MRMAVCVCAVGDEERCQRHSEPKLTFPPDWEDEERMHFLMGPFSPTTLTSLSLKDQKVQFWISLVRDACRLFRQPVFSGQQMAQRRVHGRGTVLCGITACPGLRSVPCI